MDLLKQHSWHALLPRWRRKSPATAALAVLLSFAQVQTGLAAITNSAIASGTYNGAGVSSAPSNVAIPVAGSTPSLTVTKTATLNDDDGTPGLSAGDTIDYAIAVENTGNVTITGTILTDTITQAATSLALTSGPTLVSGDAVNPGDLDVGETWNYTAVYTLTVANLADGSDISNRADFSGTGNSVPVNGTSTVLVPLNMAPGLELTKISDTSGLSNPVAAGDVIGYTITVANTGDVTLTDIAVADPNADPGSITYTGGVDGDSDNDIDTLVPGATTTVTATHTITQADLDAGTVSNQATGTGNDPGGNPVTDVSDDGDDGDGDATGDPTDTLFTPSPSLELTKTATVATFASPGDTLTWDLTVTNTGNVTLTALTVSDPIAETLVCPTSGDATIAALAPAQVETCAASYTVTAADVANGSVSNTAAVDGLLPGGGAIDDEDTSVIGGQPADLVTVKVVTSAANPAPGDIVEYVITVTNNGPASATGVTLTDTLPAGLTATAANGTVSAGSYNATSGLWTIGTLANGASATLMLQGTLDTGVSGTVTNVTTKADGNENDPTDAGNILDASVLPRIRPIDAVDDTHPTPLDSANPHTAVLNVLDLDTLDGSAATTGNVTITLVGSLPTGFTLNADGTVDVAQFTTPGIYTFDYQICEIADPTNCDIATVTIEIIRTLPSISGTVFLDTNSDGIFDAGDLPQGGYIVQLVLDGVVVATTTTDTDGNYLFEGFDAGTYEIIFIDPDTNMGVGYIGGIIVERDDVIIDQDLPIDPSGVVYDSETGLAVAGATVRITDAGGTPLPAACLLQGQQNQTTGSDGGYRFDIVAGAAPACPAGRTEYRLEVIPPAGYQDPPSQNIPPRPGALDALTCPDDVNPGGSCALSFQSTPPPLSSPSPYYFAFLIATGDPDVVNNHIPIDPLATVAGGSVTLTKTAHIQVARRGDLVVFTLTARNNEPRDLTGLALKDTLPAGFAYVPGSATVDGIPFNPVVSGRMLTFAPIDIATASSVTIRLSTRIGASVSPGRHTNVAQVTDGSGTNVSNRATATVRVEAEHVFDCGEVIGKVFDDKNRNGYQDDGEPGLPGVRVVTVKGLLITTDAFGRYSVPCAALPDRDIGSNFILKLDPRTLPSGYEVTSENPRVVRLTRGKVTKLNFGATATHVINIDLDARAFVKGSAEPVANLASGVRKLFAAKGQNASALSLTYRRGSGESNELAKKRLEAITSLVQQEWAFIGGYPPLPVETRILKGAK